MICAKLETRPKWLFLECNSELGMESKIITDSLITASSALSDFPSSNARLNTGTYNKNSWCAKTNDINQYLQVGTV